MNRELQFSIIQANHARDLAELHVQGIQTGFVSSLGHDFVVALYRAISQRKSSFGLVAEQDQTVLGFAAFTKNVNRLYEAVIFRRGIWFAFLLAGKLLSPARMKKAFETLLYPARIRKMNLPSAELLSIVVRPEERRKGLARQLIEKGLQECQRRGIDRVKVLVGADNVAANTLYRKCGFEPAGQIKNHGVLSNIYVAETGTRKVDGHPS
jgi:ribosomal protein S18 acetylase RimI-like enzyme